MNVRCGLNQKKEFPPETSKKKKIEKKNRKKFW